MQDTLNHFLDRSNVPVELNTCRLTIIYISGGNFVFYVARTLLLTYPCCEYGSSRHGNRAIIPSAYITLTLLGGDVLMHKFNDDSHSVCKRYHNWNFNNVSLYALCILTRMFLSSQQQECLSSVFWLNLSKMWFLHTLAWHAHRLALLLGFFQST